MLIGNHGEPDKLNLNATQITSNNNDKHLDVQNKSEKKLRFDVHIKSLRKKAGQKLSALAKISSYLI